MRDAAFVDAEEIADFFHRHFVGVIHENHFLVTLAKVVDGFRQSGLQLAALADEVGAQVGRGGKLLRALAVSGRARIDRGEAEMAQLRQPEGGAVPT